MLVAAEEADLRPTEKPSELRADEERGQEIKNQSKDKEENPVRMCVGEWR